MLQRRRSHQAPSANCRIQPVINLFRYRRAPLVDPYQIKNERLFITFLLATQAIFSAFGVLSILTEKTFAGAVNLLGGAVLALLLLGYARFG